MTALGHRAISDVFGEWRPSFDEKWVRWIHESYQQYRSTDVAEHLEGTKQFATILGDSGAPELCILVALYGLTLEGTEKDRNRLESHIRIITFGLGMERHREGFTPDEGAPSVDFGNRDKWLINRPEWEIWRDEKLGEFDGDRTKASDFSVRLACLRASVISTDVEPTFDTLCDPDRWTTNHEAEQGGGGQAATRSEST